MSISKIKCEMISCIDEMCAENGGWCYHQVALEKLDIVALADKIALLVEFSELRIARQTLIEANKLTGDDCLIHAIFGPGNDLVAKQLEDMNAEMRQLAARYNGTASVEVVA